MEMEKHIDKDALKKAEFLEAIKKQRA